MVPSVSAGIAFPVVLVACLVPLGGFLSVALGGRAARVDGWLRLGLWVALGLSTWGALMVALTELEIGWGHVYSYTPLAEDLVYVSVPILCLLVVRRAPRLRAALSGRSGLWRLASIQIARSLGVVFLVLHARGELPGQFAYPAAWGDIAVAVTVPLAMAAIWFREDEIRRPGSGWQAAFIAWNVMGLADHVVAVALGNMSYPGVVQVFSRPPTTAMFAGLPMLLFPVYMVPFACAIHLILIDVIRHPVRAAKETPASRFERTVAVGGRA